MLDPEVQKPGSGSRSSGAYVEIELSRGMKTKISPEDEERVRAHRWWIQAAGPKRFYARRVVTIDGVPTAIYLHRFILNAPSGLEVDHINGDRLDNRRENLRLCTRRQNTRNSRAAGDSGLRGVSKSGSRWRARILHPGAGYAHLGTFATPEEAARAFDRAARRLHGAFARLNFST